MTESRQVVIGDRSVSIDVPQDFNRDWYDSGASWWRDHWPEDTTSFALYVAQDRTELDELVEAHVGVFEGYELNGSESVLAVAGWELTTYASGWGVIIEVATNEREGIAVVLQGYRQEIAELHTSVLVPSVRTIEVTDVDDE